LKEKVGWGQSVWKCKQGPLIGNSFHEGAPLRRCPISGLFVAEFTLSAAVLLLEKRVSATRWFLSLVGNWIMEKAEYKPHLSPFLEGMWKTEEFKIKELAVRGNELEGIFVPCGRHKVILYFRRLKRRILTGKDRPDFLSLLCGERFVFVLSIILLGKVLNKPHKDADVFALDAQMTCRRHLPFTWDGEVYGKVRIQSAEELERYHKFEIEYALGDEQEFVGTTTLAYMKKKSSRTGVSLSRGEGSPRIGVAFEEEVAGTPPH
jgi:hypothetical protein